MKKSLILLIILITGQALATDWTVNNFVNKEFDINFPGGRFRSDVSKRIGPNEVHKKISASFCNGEITVLDVARNNPLQVRIANCNKPAIINITSISARPYFKVEKQK